MPIRENFKCMFDSRQMVVMEDENETEYIGIKIPAPMLHQIKEHVDKGTHFSMSEFIRDCIRRRLEDLQ